MKNSRQGVTKVSPVLSRGWNAILVNTWTHENNGIQFCCNEIIFLDKNAGVFSGTREFICDDATECVGEHPDNILCYD